MVMTSTPIRRPRRPQRQRSSWILLVGSLLLVTSPVARPVVTCLVTGEVQVEDSECCEVVTACCSSEASAEPSVALHAHEAGVDCDCCVLTFDRVTRDIERSRRDHQELTGWLATEVVLDDVLAWAPAMIAPLERSTDPCPIPAAFLTQRLLL